MFFTCMLLCGCFSLCNKVVTNEVIFSPALCWLLCCLWIELFMVVLLPSAPTGILHFCALSDAL